MDKSKIQTLKGFRDFLPSEMRKRQYVINKLKEVFESYGFEPLETPALEYEEILMGKYGEEGDKLIYRFTDNGDRRVALRYDQTVPLARVVAQYQNELPFPFKRYQIQPVWRAENTQKGRFREFLQCDADIVGADSFYTDAELIVMTGQALQSLGFKQFKILVNDREIFKDIPDKAVLIIDKLKKVGAESVIQELVDKKLAGTTQEAQALLDKIQNSQPTPKLEMLLGALGELGLSQELFKFEPTLARGLDYYTGTIFEIEVQGYQAGSVCGGGRYDNLIGMFVGREIPAVGFAFGFDRLIEAMEELDLFPASLTTTKVLVTVFSMELGQESIEVAKALREKGVNTELWLDAESKLDKQFKYADKKGIPFCVVIGPDEARNNLVTLKSLQDNTQSTLSLDEVISQLSS